MNRSPGTWRWGDELSRLARVLDRGGFLAIPTESSYGLAADPCNATGVAAIYEFKGRPPIKALPVVLGELGQLARLGGDPRAPELAELAALWPAPLTVIVPIRQPIAASAGTSTLAVRIPSHDRLRSLLLTLDRPLTATSANPAGGDPVSVLVELRRILAAWPSILIDDGDLTGGAASTLVQPTAEGYAVLREGAIDRKWLETRLTRPVFSAALAEIPADESAKPL